MMKLRIANLRTQILICFVVWLVFACLGLAIGLTLTDWLQFRSLSSGVGIFGKVLAKEPQNHRIVRYSFQVGPQTFEGVGHGGRGNPSFDELNVGDQVIVFYDPASPNVSCMGYPQLHQRAEAGGIAFLMVFLSLIPLALTIILMVVLSTSTALYNKRLQPTPR